MQHRRITAWVLICLLLFGIFAFTAVGHAATKVRVGYYYSSNFQEGMSDGAVKRGYGYEYLQSIANYADWQCEYVYGDSSVLYDMLLSGEIDLLMGLAYTQERGKVLLFPEHPMGQETYTIYRAKNSNVTIRDYSRIGTIEGDRRSEELKSWIKSRGLKIDVREFKSTAGMDAALEAGWIDACVEADTDIRLNTTMEPIERIGQADYYMCVASDREDLLEQLNSAQSILASQQPEYLEQLDTRYFSRSAVRAVLTPEEWEYIQAHPVLKVGYVKDYLPYSSEEDGKCIGLVTDLLDRMVRGLKLNDYVTIEYTGYETPDEMTNALLAGEVAIVFPVAQSVWHADSSNTIQTTSVCSVTMALVYALDYDDSTVATIAINEKDPLSRVYAELYYPNSELVLCMNEEEAIGKVRSSEVSCTIINSMRERRLMSQRENALLNSYNLDHPAQLCFAAARENSIIADIFNRAISLLEEADIQADLFNRAEAMNVPTFWDFVLAHFLLISGVIFAVGFLIVLMIVSRVVILRRKNKQLQEANEARRSAEKETLRMLVSLEFDDLTKLYTRQAFNSRARSRISEDPSSAFDLLIGDVDNFKLINSVHGVRMGDQLLMYLANELKRYFPEALIGRIDADRFALLINSCQNNIEMLSELVRDIEKRAPVSSVTMKFGVYHNVTQDVSIQLACDRAMIAAKSIKGKFDRNVAEYDDPHIERLRVENELEAAFTDAINKNEFVVWYQPKYDLNTGKAVGAEALVRWRRSADEMIQPNVFITLFERDGLIRQLDEYVFRRVCKDLNTWIDSGITPLPISVNLSRSTLHSNRLSDHYREILEEYGLSSDLIALELTESATVGDIRVRELTDTLTKKGFALHMDDFGSGYSSLASLNALSFSMVKIDKTLIDAIGEGSGNEMLSHVIEICHFRGMAVIAEGVEKKSQIDFLKKLGCDMAQGYYFTKPIAYEAFTDLLIEMQNAPEIEDRSEESAETTRVSSSSLVRYLSALGNIYTCVYVVDLVNNSIREYSTTVVMKEFIKEQDRAGEQLRIALLHMITPEYANAAVRFVDLSTLNERMRGKRSISQDIVSLRMGWVRAQFIAVAYDHDEKLTEVMFTIMIIEEEKRREGQLIKESRTDQLTGLNNRHAFVEDTQTYSNANTGNELPKNMVVVSMDVNGLKDTNDRLGHAAGDELLRGAADCMIRSWGCVGHVYRMGGDEFIAITRRENVDRALEQFKKHISLWFGSQVSAMSIAYGIACADELQEGGFDELMALADRRMYDEKRHPKEN